MLNHYFFLILLMSTFMISAQEKPMTSSEKSSFKEKVIRVSKNTETIWSEFVQYKHLEFLTSEVKTSGNLYFKAPDRVKWEYTDPFQYSVIFKNDQLLINDGGSKSKIDIGSNRLFKTLNQLIIHSVRGDMFEDSEFEILFFNTPRFKKVVFIPRDKNVQAYISQFEMYFNAGAEVVEVKMVEPSKDFTRIVFRNRILNAAVHDSVFSN